MSPAAMCSLRQGGSRNATPSVRGRRGRLGGGSPKAGAPAEILLERQGLLRAVEGRAVSRLGQGDQDEALPHVVEGTRERKKANEATTPARAVAVGETFEEPRRVPRQVATAPR